MQDAELVEWLLDNGGPILRRRVARELAPEVAIDQEVLLSAALATPELQRWIANLESAAGIHGSTDRHAENALAKLLEFGLDRTTPTLHYLAQPWLERPLTGYDPLVLYPFLVRAGYADHERVAAWLAQRVESLYRTARRGDFDLYLSAEEAADVPKAWRGKPIYKADYGFDPDPVYALPSCYDFYALAYCPPLPDRVGFEAQAEAIVDYLSDPRFQSTIGGYGWNRSKRTCYAGGRGYLACSEPGRLVLFLELGAKFASARNSEWFRQGLAVLESYRTAAHTYRFPADLLMEKPGYYLYGGFHMGLGESRRTPLGLELESTFRMLIIRRRLQR